MPQITSYSDANATRRQREIPGGHHSWRTDFMKPPAGVDEAPTAFLSESTAGRVIRTHYHALDQFHIIVKGGGTLGKHVKILTHLALPARAPPRSPARPLALFRTA